MPAHPIFKMQFARVYPLYVQKAERKGRAREQVEFQDGERLGLADPNRILKPMVWWP